MNVRSSIFWSFLSTYAVAGINFVFIVIISRILSPGEIGIYSVAFVVFGFASMIRDAGIGDYIVQEVDLSQDRLRTARALSFVLSWFLAAMLWGFADSIAQFYAEPAVARVMSILAIGFLIIPFGVPAGGLLRREMAFRQLFWVGVLATIGQTGLTIALALAGFSYESLAWGNVASIAIATIVLIVLNPQSVLLCPRLVDVRKVLGFGLPSLGQNFALYLDRYAAELMIGKAFGFVPVALFNRALATRDIFNEIVYKGIAPVVLPSFSAQARQGIDFKQNYLKATSILLVIAWPFYGVLALTAEPVISVLFGDQWLDAAPLLGILCLAGAIGMATSMAPQALIAVGAIKVLFWVQIVLTVVRLALVIVAVGHSLELVAYVFAFTNFLTLLTRTYLLKRLVGINLSEFVSMNTRTILVTVSTVVLTALWLILIHPGSGVVGLLATMLFSFAVWSTFIFTFKHAFMNECISMYRHMKIWVR